MSYAMNPIMDLYRNPRHRQVLESPQWQRSEVDRSCGDQVHLALKFNEVGEVSEAGFHGEGCSLCLSSAELACRLILGKTTPDVLELARSFEAYLARDFESPGIPGMPAEFEWYSDLRRFPMRQKCALMVWSLLQDLSSGA